MDEVLKAIEALSTRVDAFVNESQTAKDAAAQAQVDAEALESARTDAVSAYRTSVEAIEAADLLEPTAEGLRDRAAKGEDITSAIEAAKASDAKYLEAAAKRANEAAAEDEPVYGRVREAGETRSAAETLKGW